jgi:hypothetical protein
MQNKIDTIEGCSRRFGVELEYNSTDKVARSMGENNLPTGIYMYAQTISKKLKQKVEINKWHYTNNNERWVLKPDASCGIEICSPPLIGSFGTLEVSKVVESLAESNFVAADNRCSCHVHVEIADFLSKDIINLFKRWTSYELFFFFLTSPTRWLNQYCQPIGFSFPNLGNYNLSSNDIIEMLSDYKYYAINLYHYKKGKKRTVEFRIMDSDACLFPEDVAIWCKLLLCFVDRVKNKQSDDIDVKYKSIQEALDFLDLESYFGDSEVSLWIVERLSKLVDSEGLFDKCKNSRYIWNDLVNSMNYDIKSAIQKIEEKIL